MDNDAIIPVLDTRKVLLNHLKAKIQSSECIVPTDALLQEISNNLTNKDLIVLLENDKELEDKIKSSELFNTIQKETIGEDLFFAVSQIDTELCAQLTGMLLELDIKTVKSLLEDPDSLREAVRKAKQEYLKYTKANAKYLLGEELFELVISRYPNENLASQLTGMLLELDVDTLNRMISNPSDLDEKLLAAHSALNEDNFKISDR